MTDFRNFKGAAKRIEDIDLPRLGYMIGVGEDELHAFMDTESLGKGFDGQGRPKMLFEPHVFYKHLSGEKRKRAVNAGLAYAKWGTKPYPKDSYPRLKAAIEIDETAALKAASWGLAQLLGENHAMGGYATPQAMVLAFMDDEDRHLEAAVRFIEMSGIGAELRKLAKLTRPTTPQDAVPIVKTYNGPGYAKNDYHTKFAKAHNKWRKIKDTSFTPTASDEVIWKTPAQLRVTKAVIENVQSLLRDKGFPEVGEIDGKMGKRTITAIETFQTYANLPKTGKIDDRLLAELVRYSGRPQAPARANATVSDIKDQPAVSAADTLKKVGAGVTGVSAIGTAAKAFDIEGWVKGAEQFRSLSETVMAISPWAIGLAVGGTAIYFASKIIRAQLVAYREGRSL